MLAQYSSRFNYLSERKLLLEVFEPFARGDDLSIVRDDNVYVEQVRQPLVGDAANTGPEHLTRCLVEIVDIRAPVPRDTPIIPQPVHNEWGDRALLGTG